MKTPIQNPYYYTLNASSVPNFRPEDLQISIGHGLLMVDFKNKPVEDKKLIIQQTEDGSFTFEYHFTDVFWINVSVCSHLRNMPECNTWAKVCDVKTKNTNKLVFFFKGALEEYFEEVGFLKCR